MKGSREEGKGRERNYVVIIPEKLLNFMKDHKPQIQEPQGIPSRKIQRNRDLENQS
jgi:hypothetical protein